MLLKERRSREAVFLSAFVALSAPAWVRVMAEIRNATLRDKLQGTAEVGEATSDSRCVGSWLIAGVITE